MHAETGVIALALLLRFLETDKNINIDVKRFSSLISQIRNQN